MLFNSLAFAVFLPTVFALYWILQARSLRLQNLLLLAASYLFYGWWDWRFLALIVFSTAVDYGVARAIAASTSVRARRWLLSISIVSNLSLLGFFKYFNFFVDSAVELLSGFGFHASPYTLQVILPVGISFYTFQSLSYTIDVYRRQMEPTRDPIAFFAYVAFFPQLVAGPIERARHLLPQFLARREFDRAHASDGLRQILWGLFKKVVIADSLAPAVDAIFTNHQSLPPGTLLLGTVYFAVQIYCDFSGYSDMAIGTARLFGFSLSRNFAFPYFSRDIAEFWRRWHISLSSWFRDYVYIPLGGSRTPSRARHLANLIITFTISGFWHGSNWTFVVWGFLNGLYYVPLVLAGRNRANLDTIAQGRLLPSVRELAQLGATFGLTLLAWVFFRADSVSHALSFLHRMATGDWLANPLYKSQMAFVLFVILVEWVQRERQHALEIPHFAPWTRWATYYALLAGIFAFARTEHVPFIYFQF
jgi:alginate O-acetyltransferase complex protein AlgI